MTKAKSDLNDRDRIRREETVDVGRKTSQINVERAGVFRGLCLEKGNMLQIHFSLRKNDI